MAMPRVPRACPSFRSFFSFFSSSYKRHYHLVTGSPLCAAGRRRLSAGAWYERGRAKRTLYGNVGEREIERVARQLVRWLIGLDKVGGKAVDALRPADLAGQEWQLDDVKVFVEVTDFAEVLVLDLSSGMALLAMKLF